MSPLPPLGQTQDIMLDGPVGRIEGVLSSPREPLSPPAFAIVGHPHPLMGGAMTNKVTYMLASTAQKAGLYALRFNFRGVGESEGSHDDGDGEVDDVVFLTEWMRAQLPGARVVLAGFSFGAWVTIKAAQRIQPQLQVSVAPPFGKYFVDQPPPPRPECPWLVLHGVDDEVVPYEPARQILEAYDPAPELVTLEGVGHFFHGRLNDLQRVVQPFLQRHLETAG